MRHRHPPIIVRNSWPHIPARHSEEPQTDVLKCSTNEQPTDQVVRNANRSKRRGYWSIIICWRVPTQMVPSFSVVCRVRSTASIVSLRCGYTWVVVAAVANHHHHRRRRHHRSLCRWVDLPTLPTGVYCFLIRVVTERISISISSWYPCFRC